MRDPSQPYELSPAEEVALGLRAPGPLAPAVTSTSPEKNAEQMRTLVNPPRIPLPADTPYSLPGLIGMAQEKLAEGPRSLFRLAGKADVAQGIKTPEQAASRAETYGNITRDVAEAAAVPFSAARGVPGLLARAGQNAMLGAVQNPQAPLESAGLGAALGTAGELGSKGLRYLFSAIPERLFSSKTGRDLAAWLKANVPAWSEEKTNAKGLYEMAHGTGQRKLSEDFERSLIEARDSIPEGTQVQLMADMARKAGIKKMRTPVGAPKDLPLVEVDARDLLDKLPGLGARGQDVRKAALRALEQALPDGVIPEARRAYQIGSGWIDFAEKGKFLAGERYDPVKAQSALTSVGRRSLLGRGMDPVREMVRGPMESPIRKFTPSGLGYQIGKEALGAGAGATLGGPVGAGVGMLGAAMMPRPSFYSNVPIQMPALEQARRAVQAALMSQAIGQIEEP